MRSKPQLFRQDASCSEISDISRLKKLMINDSGFAFDPQTGLTYSINQTGIDIIRWLNEGYGAQKVVVRLQDEYGIDEFTASQDYESFVL